MKEMNVENQLASWQPRRASAKLKRRLFARDTTRSEMTWAVRWFAPAAVCGLLALAVLNQENGLSGNSRNDSMIAMLLSNRSPAAISEEGPRRNDFPAVTFDW